MNDFQERLRAEHDELELKRVKLIRALDNGFIPEESRAICRAQYHAMLTYLEILTIRLALIAREDG